MTAIQDQFAYFIARRHVGIRAAEPGPYITCFDEDARQIDYKTASANWPTTMQGELEALTPQAGNGHYAHLMIRGLHAARDVGGSTRYELVAPDWSLSAHVTEPARGGEPDVVIEQMTAPTGGMERFAKAVGHT